MHKRDRIITIRHFTKTRLSPNLDKSGKKKNMFSSSALFLESIVPASKTI